MSITVKSRVISEGDIRAGLAEGLSDSQIGALHGYPARHVSDQRRKHGLRATNPATTRYSDEDLAELIRMKRAGETVEAIAAKLGRSVDAIAHKLSAMGLRKVGRCGVRGGNGDPIGKGAEDSDERAKAIRACELHGVDLVREYGRGR